MRKADVPIRSLVDRKNKQDSELGGNTLSATESAMAALQESEGALCT